jgi:hypothetical protein
VYEKIFCRLKACVIGGYRGMILLLISTMQAFSLQYVLYFTYGVAIGFYNPGLRPDKKTSNFGAYAFTALKKSF